MSHVTWEQEMSSLSQTGIWLRQKKTKVEFEKSVFIQTASIS